jgi:hypothetical protein
MEYSITRTARGNRTNFLSYVLETFCPKSKCCLYIRSTDALKSVRYISMHKSTGFKGSIAAIGVWLKAFPLQFFLFIQPMKIRGDMVGGPINSSSLFFGLLPKCLHYSVSLCTQGLQNSLGFSQRISNIPNRAKMSPNNHFPSVFHRNKHFFSFFSKYNFPIYI